MFLLKKNLLPDLKEICICHKKCFPHSFSVKLGERYLIKSFTWFLEAENRFLFHVCNNENRVVGYCGGFLPQFIGDGSTSGVMQYAMREAALGIIKKPWLIFNKELIKFYPLISKNVFRKIFKHKGKKNIQDPHLRTDGRVGLVVIGVHPDFRGKKIFELLMNEFENEAVKRGVKRLVLSVRKNNLRAVNAYKKAGWSIEKENTESVEMCKQLN